jgi:hypothetical protein
MFLLLISVFKIYMLGPLVTTPTLHLLLIDFKKSYDLVRMEVLYIILIKCGIPTKISQAD